MPEEQCCWRSGRSHCHDMDPLLPDGPDEHLLDCDGPCCQTIDGATEIMAHQAVMWTLTGVQRVKESAP